ncbi:MAG: cobyrinate a,c-diamide synthase [Eubacteriales bacterium]|nr:cobyrinate a,c-diamide synthase [Eubacteriales bacterium]
MKYPRLMLAAASSGSGKTTITCGLLQCLKNRGIKTAAFKCGPDYIDPMFHETVLQTPSANLDTFFTDEKMTRYLFSEHAKKAELSVIEGVMGYYDGLAGISTEASAYDLAKKTETPVVLIINGQGMSLSIAAMIQGFLNFRTPSQVCGVILNRISPMMYPLMKEQIERECHVQVLGYVPKLEEGTLQSRHLGLVLPSEIPELSMQLEKLAEILERSIDIDGLIRLAESAPEMDAEMPEGLQKLLQSERTAAIRAAKPKIAVARDEAFCFIYKDNLKLLKELGAEITEFSPIHDRELPKDCDGLLLYGGYPELYAKELSENSSMLESVRERVSAGLPLLAECGGFMYLHDSMEDLEKKEYPMAGVIHGSVYYTGKLKRFGYITLSAEGQKTLRGHEFHYFDSTACGEDYLAKKPLRERSWRCIHRTETMTAGFPHLYYYAEPEMLLEYLELCCRQKLSGKSEEREG